MKKRYSEEEKRIHIEQWRKGGQSRSAYATEHGLAQQTFSKWVSNVEKKNNGFIEIPREIGGTVKNRGKRNRMLIRKGDLSFLVPLDAEKEMLKHLIEMLVRL